MIRKSMLISIIAALLVLLLSYGWVHWRMQQKPVHASGVQNISTTTLQTESYQPMIQAVGTLQANQGTILKAQTDGQVMQINFTAGQTVKINDVLIVLNNTQQRGALDSAIAQEKLNKVMYQRDLELKKLGAISLAAVDQAKSALDAAAAAVQEAQGAYDLTIVKAPFSGRVGISKINIGDYVQSADEMISLQNLNPMFINFYVPEKYFSGIKTEATVKIIANTLPKDVFTGKIVSYETVVDQNTGMLQVRASIPNLQEALLPGGYATVSVYAGAPQTIISVPQTALLYDEQGSYVYLVQENKAIQQRVSLGDQIKQNVQITAGLKPGDTIISAGTNKVHNGSRVHDVLESGEK